MKRRLPFLLLALALLVFPRTAFAGGCELVLGFQAMSALVDVGACLDNETSQPNGDAIQHTTRGTLVWRRADSVTSFTDGYRTWLNGPNGLEQRLNSERLAWEQGTTPAPVQAPGVVTDPDGRAAVRCDRSSDVIGPLMVCLYPAAPTQPTKTPPPLAVFHFESGSWILTATRDERGLVAVTEAGQARANVYQLRQQPDRHDGQGMIEAILQAYGVA